MATEVHPLAGKIFNVSGIATYLKDSSANDESKITFHCWCGDDCEDPKYCKYPSYDMIDGIPGIKWATIDRKSGTIYLYPNEYDAEKTYKENTNEHYTITDSNPHYTNTEEGTRATIDNADLITWLLKFEKTGGKRRRKKSMKRRKKRRKTSSKRKRRYRH
jgi:hypothetical protein